jgi:TonB family protein
MRTLFSVLSVAGWALVAGQFAFADEPVYKVGGDVTAPRRTQSVEPRYTEEARSAGVQGTVVLKVEISKKGRVENVHVFKGLRPDLDENAVAAVQQWRFEPAKKDGEPVRVAATITVSFRPLSSPFSDPVYRAEETSPLRAQSRGSRRSTRRRLAKRASKARSFSPR